MIKPVLIDSFRDSSYGDRYFAVPCKVEVDVTFCDLCGQESEDCLKAGGNEDICRQCYTSGEALRFFASLTDNIDLQQKEMNLLKLQYARPS